MDANGQHFYQLRGGLPWQLVGDGELELGPEHLRLSSPVLLPDYGEQSQQAGKQLDACPASIDRHGAIACYVKEPGSPPTFCVRSSLLLAGELQPPPVDLFRLSEDISDIALAEDNLLYLCTGDRVLVHDLGGGLADGNARLSGFLPYRVAPLQGGAWVLEKDGKRLARLSGSLKAAFPTVPVPEHRFVEAPGQDDPLTLRECSAPELAQDEQMVALDARPDGLLCVLIWAAGRPRLHFITASGEHLGSQVLEGVTKPFSLRWLGDDRLALLAAEVREALVYPFAPSAEGRTTRPTGEVYPLREHTGGPFLHGPVGKPEYPVGNWQTGLPATRPVVAASLPAFSGHGTCALQAPLDSAATATTWHRLYVEAELPPGTGFTLFLAASEEALTPDEIPESSWHPHHFGVTPSEDVRAPRGAWVPSPSEIPNHPGFLDCPPEPERAGLFTVLIQAHNRRVRTLQGRFLHLRLRLHGSLRNSPCLHALRVYAPRFSYQDKYLPALYRESLQGREAEEPTQPGTPSTRADFLGRLLANFEGVLTPIEDRVASAWMLTDPTTAPDSALEWLGTWVGLSFEPWFPRHRRRALLRQAAELARLHGTLSGLRLAIDVATGGWATQKRAVVVEDFRMRRTFQTILGLNLDKLEDPLLGTPLVSGNSIVGRTLILGEEGQARRFLALFDAPTSGSEDPVVADFFASLAFRVTVLVHDDEQNSQLDLIRRVAATAVPAHVQLQVRAAERDLVIGLSSLLGVDSFVDTTPPPPPVVVGRSSLGDGSRLHRPASLYPKLEYSS